MGLRYLPPKRPEKCKTLVRVTQQWGDAVGLKTLVFERVKEQEPKGTKPTAKTPTSTGTDLIFKELRNLEKQGMSNLAYNLVFSPDGKAALSNGDEGNIFLWDTRTGKLLHRFVGHEGTSGSFLAFSSDGQRFLSGGDDGRVCIWDVKSRKELLKFEGHRNGKTFKHKGRTLYSHSANQALFSPDDKFVLSFSWTHTLLWDATTGKQIHRLNGEGYAFARAIFSRDGRWILASMFKKSPPWTFELAVWDAQTGKEVRRLAGSFKGGYLHQVLHLAGTPSGKHLVACCRDDQTIRTWEIESGKEIKRVPVTAKDRLSGFVLAFDGRLAITWERKFVKKWTSERIDFGGGRFEIRATQKMVPEGDPTVHLWHVESGKRIASKAYKGELSCAAFSPDGRQLLLGGGKQVQLWELVKGSK
jgi:WD40 repeat protein